MSETDKYPASTPEQLLQRIHSEFPEITWDSYVLNTEGWDHDVIILDNKIVFRFPNDDEYSTLLRDEIEVLKKLAPLVDAAIPQYTYIAADYSFAGYPIVPGRVVSKQVFDELSKDARHEIAKQLAAFLSTLHTLIDEGHKFPELPDFYIPADHIEVKQLAQEHLPQLLSPEEYATVEKILNQIEDVFAQNAPAVFVHDDVYSRHILWDDKKSHLGIIDFTDMCLGDPGVDFAELHEYGAEFVKEVYDLYTGPKDDNFLERAWIYQQWIAVSMMTDHFINHKTSFAVARETFDRVLTAK